MTVGLVTVTSRHAQARPRKHRPRSIKRFRRDGNELLRTLPFPCSRPLPVPNGGAESSTQRFDYRPVGPSPATVVRAFDGPIAGAETVDTGISGPARVCSEAAGVTGLTGRRRQPALLPERSVGRGRYHLSAHGSKSRTLPEGIKGPQGGQATAVAPSAALVPGRARHDARVRRRAVRGDLRPQPR